MSEEEQIQKVNDYDKMLEDIKKADAQARFEKSGVPIKFFNSSFSSFQVNGEEAFAYDLSKQFAENPENKVLIFCGNNGTGKTHLACAVIRNYGGEYITSSMLALKYESAVGYKADMTREEIILHYSRCKMLVIDECCKYFLNSELEKFLLIQIVCNRYENNLPTILISNAKKNDLVAFMGKAVFDRLCDVCTAIEFDWQSRRRK